MKFSLNWLREFVELPNDTTQLADLLTLAGVEIEGVESRGANFEHVVVAQITASAPHPNADRLSVCQVDDGSGQSRQIVCGAKNYQVGDKVPLALPGAVLANDLKIRASKLRGVESQGMLCSPKELALSDESAGLLILSPEAKIGAPISELFPNDTALDVEITPNRPDLLSHYGLAREIAALTNQPLRQLEITEPRTVRGEAVQISAPNECPFYSARCIEKITVGPSPDWLRARLESAGLRAINNIVDITNFVMLEIGQPLHAFDVDKLQGGIDVRLARPNEKFLALDGRTYELGPKNLLIADAARGIAIGGVMGGEDTGVSATTRNVLLESAYFSPSSIRRTARELNLPSDASYRFERGVDPGMVLRASERAAQLIGEIAGGVPARETISAGTLPAPPAGFSLRYAQCRALLGTPVPPAKADRILEGFGLQKLGATEEQSTWGIPSYRSDLRREVDLIEEIVRVFGIDRITGADRSRFTPASAADRRYDFEMKVRQRLAARGFSEARTSALIGRSSLGGAFVKNALELRNPLSEDHVALRPSLIPGLLGALERNVRAGARSIRLFELGRVFSGLGGKEITKLALLLSGDAESEPHWRAGHTRQLDLFDLKGALVSAGLEEFSLRRLGDDNFALFTDVVNGDQRIGFAGQLSSGTLPIETTAPVFAAEIDLDLLNVIPGQSTDAIVGLEGVEASMRLGRVSFRELDRFPAIVRDISMIVPETLTHEKIYEALFGFGEPLLVKVKFFDRNIRAGRKSLAYSLTYRDKNRTLTSDEVSAAHGRIRERLKSELGVELRE
jgi:phenylalanyl-tRNA synthetase beta chain